MSKFTQDEIDAEHRHRKGQADDHDAVASESGDVCIHCGATLSYRLPEGQEAGLCGSCDSQDN